MPRQAQVRFLFNSHAGSSCRVRGPQKGQWPDSSALPEKRVPAPARKNGQPRNCQKEAQARISALRQAPRNSQKAKKRQRPGFQRSAIKTGSICPLGRRPKLPKRGTGPDFSALPEKRAAFHPCQKEAQARISAHCQKNGQRFPLRQAPRNSQKEVEGSGSRAEPYTIKPGWSTKLSKPISCLELGPTKPTDFPQLRRALNPGASNQVPRPNSNPRHIALALRS